MDRREALTLTAVLFGGTIVGSPLWLAGCTAPKANPALFDRRDLAFLDAVGETILPQTDRSPGAKAAHIGAFMKTIVTDCYDAEEQQLFVVGIEKIKARAKEQFAKTFMHLSADEKLQLIAQIDGEASAYEHTSPAKPHYFTLMKQLTIWGYFSSEPGCTQALRYNPVPGRYEGCVPYQAGEKAWY